MNDRIRARLEQVPQLVAGYLFGSRARGEARPSSDVDIGIWLERAPRSFDEYPFDVAADLEQALGIRVDLVVLNDAPSDLVHRVLRDGELLVERDRSLRIRFETRSRSDYRERTMTYSISCTRLDGSTKGNASCCARWPAFETSWSTGTWPSISKS